MRMTPLTTIANFAELRALLETPKKILITTHFKPDADAIGSSLGLLRFLRGMGHDAIVAVPSDYPSFLFFLEK